VISDASVDASIEEVLERFRFDRERFSRLRAQVASGELSPASNVVRGRIEPLSDGLTPLPEDGETRAAGLEALSRGEVAAAVLNGGMATRFGGVVKGVVEAVDGRSFLEWKIADTQRAGVPLLCMNSFATDDATRAFVRERGLPEPLFFAQSVSLRLNRDGSLFRDRDGRLSPHSPGHGDFNEALRASGLVERLRSEGVRLVMLSNVDNLGARVDPLVLGAHVRAGRPMTIEVVAKRPGDTGGSPVLVDGAPMLVEGFRFPPSFDQDRVDVFATNSFVFDLEALDRVYPLTWFYVEKEVDGRPAVQLERLVNELSTFLPTTYLSIPRDGPNGRFFPIKTPDDLVEAQPALRQMLRATVLS
jgi:UTP--glucose-1-phosphate uridylyltransferase